MPAQQIVVLRSTAKVLGQAEGLADDVRWTSPVLERFVKDPKAFHQVRVQSSKQ